MNRFCWFFYINWQWLIIAFSIAIGICWRLTPWSNWPVLENYTSGIFLPLVGNADGYFYLGLARDLIEDLYDQSPWLRVFPENFSRPDSIPLISAITAKTSQFFEIPVEFFALIIPAILGVFIIFPIFIFGKQINSSLVAASAGFFIILIPYYAQRTGLGWYDTDSLIVTLPLIINAVTMILIQKSKNLKLVIAGFLSINILVALFYNWWDQAPQIVFLLSIYPILLLLILSWSFKFLRFNAFLSLFIIFLLLPISFIEIFHRFLSLFGYIFYNSDGIFSPTAIAIGEQQAFEFQEAARLIAGNIMMLILAFCGFLYLSLKQPVFGLLLLPFLTIGLLGFFAAERFLIFLAPIVAIGLSGVLIFVYANMDHKLALPLVIILCLTFSTALMLARDGSAMSEPIVPLSVVEPMVRLSQELPQDAVLWNLCDYGYALTYWARRATVCDGSSHTPARRTFTATALFADKDIQSARFIHFYLNQGHQGMDRILQHFHNQWPEARNFLMTIYEMPPTDAKKWLEKHWLNASPEEINDWLNFLFPKKSRPAYLVLDRQTMRNTHWWYWFSTWDPKEKKGIHPYYILFPYLPDIPKAGPIEDPNKLFWIDWEQGVVSFRSRTENLRYINWIRSGKRNQVEFNHSGHWIMDIVMPDGYAILHDPLTHNKVGHTLYSQTMDSSLFEPVLINGVEFQVWQVHHPDDIQIQTE